MGTNPPETLLQSFHTDVRVDRLASEQDVYENHSFTVPENCRHDLAGWGNCLKLFLPRRSRVMPLHVLPFRRGLEVTNPPWQWCTRNRHPQPRNEQMIFLCFLCSLARLQGAHRAHTFEYPNWRMILSTLPLPIPSIAASSLVVILRSFRIWLSARCIVAGVTAVDGQPERRRSNTLPCPCYGDANRFAQWLTVLLSTVMSP
jgi:hypothetical protein